MKNNIGGARIRAPGLCGAAVGLVGAKYAFLFPNVRGRWQTLRSAARHEPKSR